MSASSGIDSYNFCVAQGFKGKTGRKMDVHEEKTAVYEFDAPHIIDFSSLDKDDNADNWFDQVADLNTGGQLITPLKTEKPLSRPRKMDLPKVMVSPRCHDGTAATVAGEGSRNAPVLQNVVTSWGNPVSSTSGQPPKNGPSCQPRRVSKRKEAARQCNPRKGCAEVPATPPAKKPRRNVKPFAVPVSVVRRRRSSTSRSLRRSGAAGNQRARRSALPAAGIGRIAKLKSSEQLEVERMQALQKEVAERRKKNEASFKAAVSASQPVRKPVLSTTVPVEFHFRTDERLKQADGAQDSYKEVDFNSQLRKHPASPAKGPRGATVPKPFNLSGPAKRKHVETENYVSAAQQIEQFHKRTPARYHLRSRQREEKGPSPMKNDKLKITHPQTPQLMKRQRIRPVAAKSSAEAEEEELETIRQFKFKALEVNRKILEGALMPRKPAPKEPTQPEAFHLETDRRIQERQASRKPEEPQDHTFHPRPLPLRILEDVVGVPQKRVQNPTVPESPAFTLKNRLRVEHKVEPVKPASLKANPVPFFGLPFQPKLPEKNQVEVCPFSFDAREQERLALKEKRLEELRNEEVPKFKAQMLPDFSEVHLPSKKVAVPTQVEPFKLLIDQRGAAKSERWERQMKEELKQQMGAAMFKARPNTVVHKEPFLPKKENRSVVDNTCNFTVAEGFQLNTERRAKERLEFDQAVCEKETLRACMEEERRKEEEERERDEVARLRQEQVHKAQPVRHYKPLEVKRGEVPLTVPQSPNFSDRFRF
ncbi:hypothetical protein SKAU_G00174670 [Synaphobranchus kaupii]|uniref:Targeting protein for Xklp2 n=1 Tax=Synaphobranchus kaupii TaxID=118154 RepID=A0A9Q1FLM2_SYNKA|nr:hypothetical protein SKAU_G00174670 [Synaphobranchus kaupii]